MGLVLRMNGQGSARNGNTAVAQDIADSAARVTARALAPETNSPLRGRDYVSDVLSGVSRMSALGLKIQVIARIPGADPTTSYPIIKIESHTSGADSKPWILLSAGTHGDEPAGVLAVMQFVRTDLERYRKDFNFLIFPCINPSGYAQGTRNNTNDQNINRRFTDNSDSAEAWAILEHINKGSPQFLMAIDCHEDSPEIAPDFSNKIVQPDHSEFRPTAHPDNWSQQAYSFYTYETARFDPDRVATRVISELRARNIDIWTAPILYDDRNDGGIIRYGPNHHNHATDGIKDLDTYIARRTGVVLTMETPTGWDLAERIRTHSTAICAALDAKLEELRAKARN